MALNTNIVYPPVGFPNTGPYRIHQDWCIGDSLNIINSNFENFDTRVNNLSSFVQTINTSLVACCSAGGSSGGGGGGPSPTPTPTGPTPPTIVPTIVGLVDQTLGGGNTKSNIFIVSDGTLRVTGSSSAGELGIGNDRSNTTVPRIPLFDPPIFPGEIITKVVPQGDVIYVITSFGRLYGAGQNSGYQLGLNNSIQQYTYKRIYLEGTGTVDAPSAKPPGFFVKKIAVGSGGTSANITLFALTDSGDVYVWGSQAANQTGMPKVTGPNIGNNNYIFQPQLLTTINNVKDIASGGNNNKQTTFFHKNDDTLWVTGENTTGAAGIGAMYAAPPHSIPLYGDIKNQVVQVTAGIVGNPGISNNVKKVFCGGETGNITAWVITHAGRVFGTGYNNNGQAIGALISGNKVSNFTLVSVSALLPTELIGEISGHSDSSHTTIFALIETGVPGEYTIKGWGSNVYGQLGIGTNTATVATPTAPLTPPWEPGAKVKQLCVAGDNAYKATLVLDTDNKLWVAGYGGFGLLGNGLIGSSNTFNTFKLVSISPGYGVPVEIRATNTSFSNMSNFLVLLDTGKVLGFGYDHPSSGQLAVDPSPSTVSVPSYVLFHT